MITPRARFDLPIRGLLIGGVGGLVLSSFAVTFALGFYVAIDNTAMLLRQQARQTVEVIVSKLREHLTPAERMAEMMAATLANHDGLPDDTDITRFRDALAMAPQLRGAAYFAADGRAVRIGNVDHPTIYDSWLGLPYVVDAMDELRRGDPTRLSWSEPIYLPRTGETLIAAYRGVVRGGRFAGVIAAAVSTAALSRFIAGLQVPAGKAFILYGREHLLAHPLLAEADLSGFLNDAEPMLPTSMAGDTVLLAFHNSQGKPLWLLKPGAGIEGQVLNVAGSEYALLYREVAGYGGVPWQVGAYINVDEAGIDRVFDRLEVAALISLVVMLVTAGALTFIGIGLRRAVQDLAAASRQVRMLEIDNVAPIRPSFIRELNQAAIAFERMIVGLRWFETYVPRTLVLRLMRRRTRDVHSEECDVTVMFTDIVGFTTMSERLGAPEVAALLNNHFALINAAVDEEDGTVDKYIGDSVMAFWGAPVAQLDHAARACRAARAIAEGVRADNAERAELGLPPIRIRIGLHSGPVTVGNVGSPGRINYTAVGDTVNVADRLQELGKEIAPDAEVCVLASEDTIREAGESAVPSGSFPLRGREHAMQVFTLA